MVPQIETYKLGEENLSRSVGFHEKGGGAVADDCSVDKTNKNTTGKKTDINDNDSKSP